MARTLAERFEAKVDRSGEHDLWTGSKKADGTGKLKVGGKAVTAPRVAWELANGPLPLGTEVVACSVKACVRMEHLSVRGGSQAPRQAKQRAARGSGSLAEVRRGVYKLVVHAGRYDDGSPRRVTKTVRAPSEAAARRELAGFVADVRSARQPRAKADRDVTVDNAVERYLGYLAEEKGREDATVRDYRNVHVKWFSPWIGSTRVRDVDDEDIDRLFGRMRREGLSASRMQAARNLYSPFFRWAKRRGIVARSPMAEFEMPTSRYVSVQHAPPEVEQLSLYLSTALEVIPDVAPVLTLAAVTGMRRGELVPVRRTKLFPRKGMVRVDTAVDGARLKPTKNRTERDVAVDEQIMDMLLRHCDRMDERAGLLGMEVASDAFVFSMEPDCSVPMPAQFVTRQLAILKDYLGIATKRPETVELEDKALALYRQPGPERPPGMPGPKPRGGMSFTEIGRRLGRTGRWAKLAVDSAQRREDAATRGPVEFFDGSIIALRKFTTTELLDAGFNIDAVAKRQGHTPEVLVRHYARARRTADARAAAHLGRVVHGAHPTAETTTDTDDQPAES